MAIEILSLLHSQCGFFFTIFPPFKSSKNENAAVSVDSIRPIFMTEKKINLTELRELTVLTLRDLGQRWGKGGTKQTLFLIIPQFQASTLNVRHSAKNGQKIINDGTVFKKVSVKKTDEKSPGALLNYYKCI